MTIHSNYIKDLFSLLFFLVVTLFWWLGYPQALNIQEENQLFLWSFDYFHERMSLPGGLADWIGECLTQFFYLPWLGALILGVLAVAVQRLTERLLPKGWMSTVLSLLPPVLLIGVMGDVNVLLSYVVALIAVFGLFFAVVSTDRPGTRPVVRYIDEAVNVFFLYWFFGPLTWLYVALRVIHDWRHAWWIALWLPALQIFYYWLDTYEYPLKAFMLGINYYRIPLELVNPWWLLIVPVAIVVLALTGRCLKRILEKKESPLFVAAAALLIILTAFGSWHLGYPKDEYELFMQDKLVREQCWQDIIARAERYQVKSNFSSNCVNLALAMTRQLAERQFTFYQSGDDALIMPMVRDNLSNWPTAEAFWHLGMVNSAKRYAYDLQESILNARRSGRCMKRIAECLIVNGQYKVAQKYLDILKQSLFYRSWAKQAEACLGNEAKVNANPEWAWLRQVRYKDNFLYSYPEMDKMLGLLFINNTANKMALDYFMGQMLLKGEVPQFMQYMGWVQRYGGYQQIPAGYADIVELMKSNGNVPGSPYLNYIKQRRNNE